MTKDVTQGWFKFVVDSGRYELTGLSVPKK